MTRRALLKNLAPFLAVVVMLGAFFLFIYMTNRQLERDIDAAIRAEAAKAMKPALEKAFAKEMEERYGKPKSLP